MGKHSYEGEGLTIHFDPKKCIHAAECVRGNAAVFNPNNKPWVKPDAAAADEVVAVVERCPTGALTYERADGDVEAADARNTVHLAVDGPVYLRGDLHIEDASGQTHELTRAALCRCGASKNPPFCDGNHAEVDFSDPGAVGEAKTKEAPEGQTFLKARVLPKGPVLLEGPYELADGQGVGCLETGSGYLCRCGASSNKPWCDGTHSKIGFEAPGEA